MNSFRPPGDNDWNYLRILPSTKEHLIMDEVAPGLYECVALESLSSKGATNSDDPPNSFRTRDLFACHPDPSKTNLWKFVSRLDDRITLVNGEKVLPIPIEGRIRQDRLIKEAAVFGIGRSAPGVLIFKSDAASDLTDDEYLDAIWSTIESANCGAESFSLLSKDLVITLPVDTTYPQTAKGTIIRETLYQQFAGVIEEAYARFENGQVGSLQLDIPELEAFIIKKFFEELGVYLESVETDIFTAGVNSLQTTRMWSMLKKELDLGGRNGYLSQNVVFEKGNVKELAKHLYSFRTGQEEEDSDELWSMRQLIENYSSFEKHHGCGVSRPKKDVIVSTSSNRVTYASHLSPSQVVTGATGSLGGFILAGILKRDNVSKVWALVRASNPLEARSRVLDSLTARNLSLSESEASKLIALPGDFSLPDFGLSEANIQDLLSSLTHVVHCAWAVNFNIPVRSFETQHIRGVHNLLNLCLRATLPSPAKMFFCSSLSAAGGTPRPARISETVVENLSHAQAMGYARSKLVSEHIMRNAMKSTGMYARVLRIGQVVGDGARGTWNETEAVPLMIRSATTVGALPALDEVSE
jgi:nucleoside-diphosphate-sugar epimerase